MQTPHAERAPTQPRVVPALERLLSQGRVDDALDLLRAALRDRPRSRAIKKGIAMLESRLLQTALTGLGDLTRVPRLVSSAQALVGLAPGELSLAVKVDGVASLANLLDRAGSSRLEAAKRLASLFDRGIIAVPDPDAPKVVAAEQTQSGRQRRPSDEWDKTAQIAVVPEAQAMLARARNKRTRVGRAKNGRGWVVACLCIWLAGAAAAAGYRYHDAAWTSMQSAASWVAGNL